MNPLSINAYICPEDMPVESLFPLTVAAVTIGDWIYVAGGDAVLGGSVQSAVHEVFTLSGV